MNNSAKIAITVLMPCLNEERTIVNCIRQAKLGIEKAEIEGEILIADNGSTDRSIELAVAEGARVVKISERGYGSALRGGIENAKGDYIIFGDADESYDFSEIGKFYAKLRDGYDLVMGNRFLGGIERGAMPILHKYLGNPLLSFIGRLFFKIDIGDFHCGLRALDRRSFKKVPLVTTGMEFASELVVKAALYSMKVAEVPTTLSKDGRDRAPHLRSFRDGWRHLRFLLLFSPRWLFFYPGAVIMAFGLAGFVTLNYGRIEIGHYILEIHTQTFTLIPIVVGFNLISFSILSRVYCYQQNLIPKLPRFLNHVVKKKLKLEHGLSVGLVFILFSCVMFGYLFIEWSKGNFSYLNADSSLSIALSIILSFILGSQIIAVSLLLSIFGIKKDR